MKILVIHGPNLNLLGLRQTDVYGSNTLSLIDNSIINYALQHNIDIKCVQHNGEGELIDVIQKAIKYDCIIINPAAYTHTSIAMRDALLAIDVPFIEVHLSNIYARESFRQKSYFSDIAIGVISGFGGKGYLLALDYAIEFIRKESN